MCFFISLYSLRAVATPGCQLGTGSGSRIYINMSTCTGNATACPVGEYWSPGSNFIVFTDVASECNSPPYNSISVQYVKTGEITLRNTAYSNNICHLTNGSTQGLQGVSVNYFTVYNCSMDDRCVYLFSLLTFIVFFRLKDKSKIDII